MSEQLQSTGVYQRSVADKQLVLQCLADLQLLNAEKIIALMVTDDLLLVDFAATSTGRFGLAERRLIMRALSPRTSGVLLVEIYPGGCLRTISRPDVEALRDGLSFYDVTLVDLLVVEHGGIRSRLLNIEDRRTN